MIVSRRRVLPWSSVLLVARADNRKGFVVLSELFLKIVGLPAMPWHHSPTASASSGEFVEALSFPDGSPSTRLTNDSIKSRFASGEPRLRWNCVPRQSWIPVLSMAR